MGASRKPPIDLPIPFIGGQTAGEQTVVGLLRRNWKSCPIWRRSSSTWNSGGGSALASDLIERQLERVAARIPVVVYMGNVAGLGLLRLGPGPAHYEPAGHANRPDRRDPDQD